MIYIFKKIKSILVIIFLLLIALPVSASNLYFDNKSTDISNNKFVEFDLLIDTQEELINAIEGEIVFPEHLIDLVDIRESNSIINFWVEEAEQIKNNTIKFSGIIPGGYSGQGNILKLIFKTKQLGQGKLSLENILVLLNDGLGTSVLTQNSDIYFNISNNISNNKEVVIVDLSDQEPPEPFTPIITKIPEIAGDDYLLVFITQDKGSGIDYYQVKEGYRPFVEVQSPYILKNQELDQKTIVRAVDKSGNERTVTIAAVYSAPWYENLSFFAIIIVVIVVFFSLRRVSWIKTKRK